MSPKLPEIKASHGKDWEKARGIPGKRQTKPPEEEKIKPRECRSRLISTFYNDVSIVLSLDSKPVAWVMILSCPSHLWLP